jgi:hypothetical protein
MDREGDETGITWKIILLCIGMTFAYFLLYPVFVLGVLLIILYVVGKIFYPMYKRSVTPEGKRINHHMLRGYMNEKYGKEEGKHIYKQFIDTLRRRGYY